MPQRTEYHKKNLSIALKGNKNALGNTGYWLGKEKPHTEETKKKISLSHIGLRQSEEAKKKIGDFWRGKKHSEETKRKMSEAKKGEKCYLWKGGISPMNNQIRSSLRYKFWEDSIKNIDNWKCKKCGKIEINKLVAHHILNFSAYPELRFAIDNGITFCRKCHNWFHRIYGRKNNTLKQVEEFLNYKTYD